VRLSFITALRSLARVWEILLRTNPLFILLFRRRRAAWKGWYDQLIR
jgi:hypothetical protein